MNNGEQQFVLNIIDQEIATRKESQFTMSSIIDVIIGYVKEVVNEHGKLIILLCGLGICFVLIDHGFWICCVNRKSVIYLMAGLMSFVAAGIIFKLSIQLYVCKVPVFHYYYCWFMSFIIASIITIVITFLVILNDETVLNDILE